jgi:hypothetical protein
LEQGSSIQQSNDGGFIIAGNASSNDGDVSGNHGNSDCWIVKLGPDNVGIEENNQLSSINIFPNPATNQLTIETGQLKIKSVEIYDVVGERLLCTLTPNPSPSGEGSASIDVSKLSPGMYFVRVRTEKGEVVKKIIKQ